MCSDVWILPKSKGKNKAKQNQNILCDIVEQPLFKHNAASLKFAVFIVEKNKCTEYVHSVKSCKWSTSVYGFR